MVESAARLSNNYRDYRYVTLQSNSPSYLLNNLTTDDGEHFAYVNSYDGQPRAVIFGKQVLEKGDTTPPQVVPWKDQGDCMAVKYVKVEDQWYLIICTTKSCQIYNQNGSRLLTQLESKKKMEAGIVNFFTSASSGYDKGTGEEFIAVGTSSGEIYHIMLSGANFIKELGFQMIDNSAVTAMACDRKSQTLAVGNSNGYVLIFECDSQNEWKAVHNIKPKDEIPVTSIDLLNRGENLYVVGFANGEIRIISPKGGQIVIELGSHSRGINAVTCHPTKSILATCSDDSFMNIFEVAENLEVNLILSSRVNDYQLVGVVFGSDSVLAAPYDFKNLVVWNHVV